MAVATKTGDPVYDTFIKRSLGKFLPETIKQLTEMRPADPIEFISNALYKAVDSYMYKKEKEKYLADCLRESQELQRERNARKARLDQLLEAEKEQKEKLRQAREDEIRALQDMIDNAEHYGMVVSPRTQKRLGMLVTTSTAEEKEKQPLAIPTIRRGPDGRPIIVRDGDTEPSSDGSAKPKQKARGRWVEIEEQVTTESGTVITVKKKVFEPASRDQMKRELGSVFDDDRFSSGSWKGTVAMTERGHFTYTGGSMGNVEPPDPLDRQLAPADNPDIWAKERFDCHTLYDHELYINCDAPQAPPPTYDVNQHHSPPRTVVREYLDTLHRGTSSEEESKGDETGRKKSRSANEVHRLSHESSVLLSEGEQYLTDGDEKASSHQYTR